MRILIFFWEDWQIRKRPQIYGFFFPKNLRAFRFKHGKILPLNIYTRIKIIRIITFLQTNVA